VRSLSRMFDELPQLDSMTLTLRKRVASPRPLVAKPTVEFVDSEHLYFHPQAG